MTKPGKQDHALLSYYIAQTGEQLNRFKDVWAAQSLLQDYDQELLRDAIDWYLANNESPRWRDFAYNATAVITEMEAARRDYVARQKMRDATLRLVAEQ